MDTKLSYLDTSQLREFIKFNQEVYPHRQDYKKYFEWQFLDNPQLENKNKPLVLICKKENQLVGQFLFNPLEWHFRGEINRSHWGFDNYVLSDCRGIYGALMALKVIRGEISYFGIGPSEIAKKMFLSQGLKVIGDMKRFIWFRNPLAPFMIMKHLKSNKTISKSFTSQESFPSRLLVKGVNFNRVENLDNWKNYYGDNTLEFSRSPEFLKWRFFSDFKEYAVYLAEISDKQIYFVVRKQFWKGSKMLFLVDYKVPSKDVLSWKIILKATKRLAKISSCDGIITMSSHVFFDKELRKSLFFNVGKENLIITNAPLNFSGKSIQNRNLVYATMADSDLEFSFWWS